MLKVITLQGFDFTSILLLVNTALNVTSNVFGQGSPGSTSVFPNYSTNPGENLVPQSEAEVKKSNQIILGIIGAVAIGGVMIYLSTTKKKHAA